MLLPRIFSAIAMVVVFLFGLFVLDKTGFMLFLGSVVMVAAWEWARLSDIATQKGRVAFAGMTGTMLYGVHIFFLEAYVLYLAPILWIGAFVWVYRYPKVTGWGSSIVRLLFGLSILVTTWSAFVVLKDQANFVTWTLILMGLIWGADTGAYFAGRRFGKTKLARHVSPGKSWEGVFGGLLLTQCGVAVFSFYEGLSISAWLLFAVIALVTVVVSVLGDLTESLFKRHAGVKDSSHLIPGHGGVLDRVDSLTSASPIFVLLLGMAGWL
ncbi:phosphatidate cytidylyltransferase [Marinomonas sp. 15G1-11]|mgnify:CR=1 FL=1|uniref:Phosphatidate cytidylyltransferase n=1 Tax=Marinomonas phaeophyticola TaxID=3004091 RepID=A0ABT4JTH8_9GAMM|nr:phosphatidate cytidylyltransferase [Marinomonas sp. 15G1-11]MCZ2721705.1 phosphatidate cytidylyltransferase [Marinomonas sp. 15G1-11]